MDLLRKSFKLSLVATLMAAPYLYYLFFLSEVAYTLGGASPPRLLIEQLGRVFILLFGATYIGFRWGNEYGLVGLGSMARLRQGLGRLLVVGMGIGLLIFLVGDTYFIEKAPFYYPPTFWFALSVPLYAAFVEGLFARFGLMTLFVRVFKNIHVANFLGALIFALAHVTLFATAGLPYRLLNYLTLISFLLNFGNSLFLGYLYARCGLAASVFVHFVANLRFLAGIFLR